MKKSNHFTIRDIARLAGVSPAAVSLYLNDKAEQFNLARATCEKIQGVIDRCNYRPNFHGRAINECRTYLVGLVIRDVVTSFHGRLVRGVERELTRQGFHMVLSETDNNPETESAAIRYMVKIGVDGCILTPTYREGEVPAVYDNDVLRGKPLVNLLYGAPSVPLIDTDHTLGSRLVAEALRQAGHRRVAYYGLPLVALPDYFLNERFQAFCDGFREHGFEVEHFSDLERLVARASEFTAVFCFRDRMAVKLMAALQARGIRVPEDISIVGYGDEDGVAEFVRPIPATVRELKEELGTLAVQYLLDKIKDPAKEIPMRTRLAPVFVPGETIAPCSE